MLLRPIWLLFFYASLLIYLCNLNSCFCLEDEVKSFVPKFDVFAVEIIVNRRIDVKRKETFRFSERYSSKQLRGIVDYRFYLENDDEKERIFHFNSTRSGGGTYYYDSKNDLMLQFAPGYHCLQAMKSDFNELFQLDRIESDELNYLPEYIFGPSKWLFYVENNRDSLQLISMDDKSGELNIRNIPSVKFNKMIKTKRGEILQMEVYFSEQNLASNSEQYQRENNAIPLLINFNFNGRTIVSLEYFSPRTKLNFKNGYNNVQLDPFILNPIENYCCQLMESKSMNNIETQLDFKTKLRFSFRANIEYFSAMHYSSRSSAFVAYDSQLAMLRIDDNNNNENFDQSTSQQQQVVDFKINRRYQILGSSDSNNNENQQCLISLVKPAAEAAVANSTQLSIVRLLFGATKLFYLGKARVRDTNALVYMETNSLLPFWLDQPVSYRNLRSYTYNEWQPNEEDSMALDKNNTNKISQLITLIYLKETNLNELMLIEIARVDLNMQTFYDKRIINVYDFIWHLDNHYLASANNRVTALNMFSLANYCNLNENQNDEFELTKSSRNYDLLLEIGSKQEGAALYEQEELNRMIPIDRDLALLSSFQDNWGLIVSMISDFKVKILQQQHYSENKHLLQERYRKNWKLKILVSFKLKKHNDKIINLIRIGRGNLVGEGGGEGAYQELVKRQIVNSMLQCYMLAASEHLSVYFAYNVLQKVCFINIRPPPEDVVEINGPTMNAFKLNANGTLDIFQTEKYISVSLDSHWFTKANIDYKLNNEQRFKKLQLYLDYLPVPINLSVTHLGESNSIISAQQEGAFKLNGFGLYEQENLNKKFANNDEQLLLLHTTLIQCRIACFSNLNCRSYSYCIHGQESECILSKISFDSEFKLIKIKQASGQVANNMKKLNSFQVELETDGNLNLIKFKKQSTCTIYNKHHLDYFKSIEMRKLRADNYLIPVSNPEQCATYCVQYNLQKYSKLSEQIEKSLHYLNQIIERDNFELKENELELLRSYSSHPLKQFYKSFIYIDWNSLKNINVNEKDYTEKLYVFSRKSLEREKQLDSMVADLLFKIIPMPQDEGIGIISSEHNYCMFTSNFNNNNDNQNDNNIEQYFDFKLAIKASRYDFEPLFLYDEIYGISLKTVLNLEQQKANLALYYSQATLGLKSQSETLKLARDLVVKGEISQTVVPLTRSQCAQACLDQQLGPWPGCKSFDYITIFTSNSSTNQIDGSNNNNGQVKHLCQLNSITLKQALENQRNDLIDNQTNSNKFMHWHYEPRLQLGFAQVFMFDAEKSLLETLIRMFQLNGNDNLNFFALSLITVFGIITGISLVIYLAKNNNRSCPINWSIFQRGKRNFWSRSNSTANVVLELPNDIVENNEL